MFLEEAVQLVQQCANRMNALYGQEVFDEWALVSFEKNEGRILRYLGPRKEDFRRNFFADVAELAPTLFAHQHSVGDFEFARKGSGTKLEAFIVVGDRLYLICNNTALSMDDIAANPAWLNAQAPFAELADKFRSSPVVA